MAEPSDPMGPETAPSEEPDEERVCSGCSNPMSRLGAQPLRTGGVPGYPDAVLWLDTYWCSQCGRMAFFTVR
ncbi:MAG: hypothetical protein L3J95_05395 [Thermoplasmata archaeon]|nr:hypothetical protein [Thermoplasmata archaeon]MCI4359835.1 hypothetical protein [Thermoplasmata archaeon]